MENLAKNYEKNQFIFSITFLFLILKIVVFLFLYRSDYKQFNVLSSTVITENYISLYVDKKDLKDLKRNPYFYIENKKYHYEIIDITRKVVKNKNKWYHEVILFVKLPKKYKDKDIVTLSLYCNRKRLYTIFESIWKE